MTHRQRTQEEKDQMLSKDRFSYTFNISFLCSSSASSGKNLSLFCRVLHSVQHIALFLLSIASLSKR